MKKYPIGFDTSLYNENKKEELFTETVKETVIPKKSVVSVYFPHRNLELSYYNDKFDLKVGDNVYVEGKLEGYRGRVTNVSYSFKIKLSDYKKVVSVIDTDIKGDFYFAGYHMITFDKNAIPYQKALSWFKAPCEDDESEDYVSSSDVENAFPIDDLSKMKISREEKDAGHEYYIENKVVYIEIDGTCGRAIVEGSKNYEIEFNLSKGEITDIKCSCFCSGGCKHQFAAMIQLDEILDIINENYEDKFDGYFALLSREVFIDTTMIKRTSGKISVEI